MPERSLYSIHLSTATTWRGGENQVWLLAKGLLARGQRTLVLAPPGAPLLERCAEARIPAAPLAIRGEIDPLGIFNLMSLLRRERPDVLHLHDGHAVLPGHVAARWLGGPLRVVAHRRTVFELKSRWKYGGRVDTIIAISAAVKEKLLAATIPAERVRVVYSGLDFPAPLPSGGPEANELRRKLGLTEGELLVAHAAALTGEKRQGDMLEAICSANERVKAQQRPGVHLALAGSGDQEPSLRQRAAQLGIQDRVHFLGFVKDLRPLWVASSAALFASEAEGLCTALIEAQGAGLPAIVTRAGGMVEVVANGETGFVVEIGDTETMAEVLVKTVGDSELRSRMGLAAARRARAKFSADAMVDGILAVYSELAGETPAVRTDK